MTGRDATVRPSIRDRFPAMFRSIPAAIRPMAPNTSALYEPVEVFQNSFSTLAV